MIAFRDHGRYIVENYLMREKNNVNNSSTCLFRGDGTGGGGGTINRVFYPFDCTRNPAIFVAHAGCAAVQSSSELTRRHCRYASSRRRRPVLEHINIYQVLYIQ